MSRPKKPVLTLGPITLRALAGSPGAWRWRAEWYPPGADGRMSTRSLARQRGERIGRDVAVERAAELLAAGVHLGRPAAPAPPDQRRVETVLDLLECWLGVQRERVGADIRKSTFQNYRMHVKAASGLPFVKLQLGELDSSHLLRLLRQLRARYADQTTNGILTTLRAAVVWGQSEGAVGKLTWPQWRPERPKQHMPSVSDVLETLRALEEMQPVRKRKSKRQAAILAVEIMLQTGARPGECAKAQRCDFDLDRGTWSIRGGEGSKTGAREVPMQPALLNRILARPPGLVFPPLRLHGAATFCWNRWIKIGATAADVPVWTCKGLRHLAVTRMLIGGVDVKTAASITGHSPMVLLKTYAHVLDSSRQRASELLAVPRGDVLPFPRRGTS